MAEFLKIMYHLVPKLFLISYCKHQKMRKKTSLGFFARLVSLLMDSWQTLPSLPLLHWQT